MVKKSITILTGIHPISEDSMIRPITKVNNVATSAVSVKRKEFSWQFTYANTAATSPISTIVGF